MAKKADKSSNLGKVFKKYSVSLTALLLVVLFGAYIYLIQVDRDADAASLSVSSDLIEKNGKEYCAVDMSMSGSFNLSQVTTNSLNLSTAPGKEANMSLSNRYTSGISNSKSKFTMNFAGPVTVNGSEKKDEFKVTADQDTYKVTGCYDSVVEISGTGKLLRSKKVASFLLFKKTQTDSEDVSFSYKFANNTENSSFQLLGMKITTTKTNNILLDTGAVTFNQYTLKPRGYFSVATTKLLPTGKATIPGSDTIVSPAPGQ